MEQENGKKFLVLKIIPFESGTTNSQNPEQDNCHWQSMCYETPLRFNISLKEIFSKSGSPRVMKRIWSTCSYGDFARAWDSLTCWLSKEFLKRCFLKIGLTKCITVCNFRNKVAMTIIVFPKCLKFDVDSRNETKKREKIVRFKYNSIWIGDHKFPYFWTG